jgi:uncharacterized protein YggE
MTRSLLLAGLVAVLGTKCARADEAKPQRSITATGTATVRFKPDAARVYFGIRTTDPSFDAARDANQKGAKAIQDALGALKVKGMEVTVGPVGIVQQDPNGRFRGGFGGGGGVGGPEIKPYVVSASMTVIVRESDPEKLRETVDRVCKAAAEGGANTSGNGPPADDGVF